MSAAALGQALAAAVPRRRWLCAAAALAAAWWPGPGSAAGAAEPGLAPPALVTAYHVAPAQRAALRQALREAVAPRLREWRAAHRLAGFRLLFNRHADSDAWDALLLLDFDSTAQMSRWRGVAGDVLAPPVLPPPSAVHTVPVDALRLRRTDVPAGAPRRAVLVIPYLSLVSSADYLTYFDGYVLPQVDGWMREGVLSGMQLLGAGFPAGRPWSHLVLLDYAGDEALAARAGVTATVRARLKEQPAWRAISENKARVREERAAIVADDLADDLPENEGEGAP